MGMMLFLPMNYRAESGDDGTVYSLDGELSKGTTVLIGTSS